MADPQSEKLQKVLARLGYGSRREMENWISAGRISVDGVVATLGDRVGIDAQLRVDGQRVSKTRVRGGRHTRVLIYNKPAGEITSRDDPQGRATVFDRLPRLQNGRWIAIGRLDINTTGLLLFTNNGELANRMMHPSSEIEREYAVRVYGQVAPAVIDRLQRGVELEDGSARFEQIRDIGGEGQNHWYQVSLKEGRNREVRRLWESQDVTVSRLKRIRFGDIKLTRKTGLGRWDELEPDRVNALLHGMGLPPDARPKRSEGPPKASPWSGAARGQSRGRQR